MSVEVDKDGCFTEVKETESKKQNEAKEEEIIEID